MNPSPKTPFLRVLKHARFLHPVVRFFYQRSAPRLEKQLMGLTFAHPIGVAAGVDKRGEYTDAMACYSPAFIEVGPLRDCRFAIENLQKRTSSAIVLGNLSNSKDLVSAFTLIYDFVDGIVLNVSLNSNISKVIDHLLELRRYNDTYKPIIFKLYPDLTLDQLEDVARYMLGSGIDGVMVGAEFVERIREKTLGLLPVIASGEISTPERAAQLLDTGADLVAVTNSPFHYGPRLIYKIVKYLDKR
jgi:dihydroorotate dehydrogenase